jgi:hypothetical protein
MRAGISLLERRHRGYPMTGRNLHCVAVDLKDPGDYRAILTKLNDAGLRPHHEIWDEWGALERRRITFAFQTGGEAHVAHAALSAFLAPSQISLC